MVDTLVLGTSAFGRVGSSPTFPTNFNSGGLASLHKTNRFMAINSFVERRNGILEGYNKVKNDLEALNTDIQSQIDSNRTEAERLAQENKELTALQMNNKSTISTLARLFKLS